jgi:RNA polymerase primary sigma factor
MTQANQKLEQSLGREPSPEEIAEELEIDREDVIENIAISVVPLSIEMPINETESALFREVYAAKDTLAVQTEQMILSESLKVDVGRLFACLSERETQILRMYFGLDSGVEMSLEEIAYTMSVSAERIRQIKNRAIKKLQTANNSRMESYLFELAAS